MVCVHDLCARVQNGFRARLLRIAIPENKMNLAVSRILFRQGLISAVVRGDHHSPDTSYTPTTQENIATRRLWLQLKYREDKPVLRSMSAVSKPSRKLNASVPELRAIASGYRSGIFKPLQPGEVIILSTPKGVMELHEALRYDVGGMVLCRVK
ncbi:30S ribosomal protein S8 [Ramicandelaber brevisporus]|nr:30S ribosomal protein S8 [Ramicandelaber brevisporus]